MTRAPQQLACLLVLLGVMLAVYTKAFRKPSMPPRELLQPQAAVDVSTAPQSGREFAMPQRAAQREAQRQRTTLLAWGRDPFTRGAATGDGSGLALAGILWDPQQPMAIINGRTVQVGAELEGYRVTDITQDRVSVTDGTQIFQLSITP